MATVVSFYDGPTSSGLMRWYAASLDCGHSHFNSGWKPFDSLSKGDSIPCKTCEQNAADAQRIEALTERVFRARFDPRFGGCYHLYRRDETSPTGVLLMFSVGVCPAVDAALREKGISPLSPTEERIH